MKVKLLKVLNTMIDLPFKIEIHLMPEYLK